MGNCCEGNTFFPNVTNNNVPKVFKVGLSTIEFNVSFEFLCICIC